MENSVERGYLKSTVIGISWLSSFRIFSRVITFGRILILARLLTPSQFGIFAIAALLLSFLETVTETGINVFLVQEKKNIDSYISSAWVVSVLRGIVLALMVIALTPFIVLFFDIPNGQFTLLLIAAVPFIRGFLNPAMVKYQKELKFNKEVFLRLSIFLFDSLVAITLAFITKDVSSFVWGLIAGAMLELVLSYVLFRPLPKIEFKKERLSRILNRGKWVTAYGIFNYIANEGDNFVVGRFLGANLLGVYQMGYKLSTLPISEISDVVNRVVFPVYTKIASDVTRLKRAFIKTAGIVTIFSLVLGAIIFLLPESFYTLILGKEWSGVAKIIPILVVYGVLRAITGIASSLFLSLRKQSYVATMTFVRVFTLLATVFPLTLAYGIVGTSYSALLSVIAETPLTAYLLWRSFRK